jgi:hypothetical protein
VPKRGAPLEGGSSKRAAAAPSGLAAEGVALRPMAPPTALEAPFIVHATARVAELRSALHANASMRVTIAGKHGRHALGVDLAVGQWQACWCVGGDAARRRFVQWLQAAFDSLACEFPGRVAYGWLVRAQASRTHWLVWGANVENVQGAPGERIPGGGQALAMATHGEGVFGIVTTPVAGVP